MKVTFIYPDMLPHHPAWKGHYYSGIGSLSSFLTHNGIKTSLIHLSQHVSKDEFIKSILDENPDVIGFSATSHAFPIVKKLAAWIKEENMQKPVICGGVHATISPDDAISADGIDMICRGEGEEPLVELCNNLEKGEDVTKIQNIWCKVDGVIHENPLRPPYQDLSLLPFPDRNIFKYKDLHHESQGFATVMVSRGCPYLCSYCCNHVFRKISGKKAKYVRFRSVDSAISEIKQIIKDFSFIKAMHFDDDILFLKEDWGRGFMLKYKEEVGVPFRCNIRPNLLDKSKVELMRDAGCFQVSIGLESGNDYIRNTILNRNLSREQIRNAVLLCKDAKINVKSFNMVGIPHDNAATILDTVKMNAELGIDETQITIFQPYQGTKLYDLCVEKGYLTSSAMPEDCFTQSSLLLDTVTPEQILMFRDYFKVFVSAYRALYALPKGISSIAITLLDKVLSTKLICKLLNGIYIPINSLYRLMQNLMREK